MSKLELISLFSWCWWLDLWFEKAWFFIPIANEFDKKIQPTFKINHPNTKLIEEDVRKIDDIEFREKKISSTAYVIWIIFFIIALVVFFKWAINFWLLDRFF